ncbi:MAG: NAD-dependent epimerase/dehydratase family protein [Alphaproteobacteria bacterium]|nr:NAD-dependent epimerase/dehydratase family protein [Alphaproteobacteria bacterium]
MVKILVTGAAGFIGAHVARTLVDAGHDVIGVDCVNDYYDADLKRARLSWIGERDRFVFHEIDIADHDALPAAPGVMDCATIIHLAAQAGVRHSIENPFAYARSNLVGHLSILELARRSPKRPRLVYASSSSVYGANTKTPFAESDRVDAPVSLYAATKRSDEMLSESYARLYGIEQIGLRFFTVYGPWGRPDMAYWLFADRILAGEPIKVFNNGDLSRDFTYIDDVAAAVVATALDPFKPEGDAPHRIYNVGNGRPVSLLRFIELIETALGREAVREFTDMQPGDVRSTCADIAAITQDFGYAPRTPLEVGIPKFAAWFTDYRQASGSS